MANNYNALFGEPVEQLHPTVNIYAIDDSDNLPLRVITFQLTPTEGRLELPRGPIGPTGPAGAPSAPWIWMGEKANATDIAALAYSTSDRGKTWRNLETNAAHYWDGAKWIIFNNAFGVTGPTGAFGYIESVNIQMVPQTENPDAWMTGNPGSQALNIKIPEKPGPAGPTGPSAAISSAADVDGTVTPRPGDTLTFGTGGKYLPMTAARPRRYTLPEGAFQDMKSEGQAVIAQMPLEALPYATEITVSGHIKVNNSLFAGTGVVVRLGNPDTGKIVARARIEGGAGLKSAVINEHLSQASDPNVQRTPSNPVAVIPALHTGQAGTLYIVGYRASGFGEWEVKQADAQLSVVREPLVV